MSNGTSNFFVAGAAAMTSNKDDWETPQQLFDWLDMRYHFTLDPCSTHENTKCEKHYTVAEDGLAQSWEGETVFCNPPYGREMYQWVRKCATEARHARIVLLIPARTDTRYFHDFIYKKPNVRVEFLRGRLKFEVGGGCRASLRPSRPCLSTSTARGRFMTWWILLFCLVVSVWGLVDTVDRDPGAARLWMAVLLVICGLAFALYAEQEGLLDWERDNSAVHVFQSIEEEE